ncbi:MAG TPA: cytochrome P450 [Solirubrobacterales bacterium]
MNAVATPLAVASDLPPGPRRSRRIAGLAVLLNHQGILRRLHARHGDAFLVEVPMLGPTAVISSPTLVKQLYTASPEVLRFAENNPLAEMIGPGSLFSLDGRPHLRERRLLLPPFHGERMKSYEGIIEEETLREIRGWADGGGLATMPGFMRITLNAILRAVFGAAGPHQRELAGLMPKLVSLGSMLTLLRWLRPDLGPLSPGGSYVRLRRSYDWVVERLIDSALADPDLEERADVLALLLRAHYDDGGTMSRATISDELLTLLAAGHETTATSLAWAVERLSRHPDVWARLRAEAEGEEAELRTATINEVQRTRPVIPATDRIVAAEEFELGDWRIPRGYRVMAVATLIHNDPRFFEHPRDFDPDRFLGRKPDTYTWIPFGGGTRRCVGAAFAQMEMDVVLRTMLRELDLQPTAEGDERWRPRGVAFAPARGGQAIFRRRSAMPT